MEPIDIILLTHNKLGNTIRCVDALYQNTESFKLTVIDDSTDETEAYFKRLIAEGNNINYVRPDVFIKCANQALNIGLSLTHNDPVVFITNSSFVEPAWLPVALIIMEQDKNVGVVGFKLLYPHNSLIIEAGEIVHDDASRPNFGCYEPSHRYTHIREVNAIGWACVLLRRAALPSPLDEDTYIGFRGADDTDNCLEIIKRGYKIIYNGYGAVYHQLSSCQGGGTEEGWNESAENYRRFAEKWAGKVPKWDTNNLKISQMKIEKN